MLNLLSDKKKLKNTLNSLPNSAGVYIYHDENDNIIYVGKAKSLKKRISQYFNKEINGKTKVLVGKIFSIKTIVTDNEIDALLLENNLIKLHKPRYNIMLKDDKTYPWICIKNEMFPRIFKTRKKNTDGSEYYGPYASVQMLNTLIDTISQLFPIRTCNLTLTLSKIKEQKYKVCLKYHIGKCSGVCEGKQSLEEYNANIINIKKIIKGDIKSILKDIETEMNNHAQLLEFERAQVCKEKLQILKNYQSKSMIVSDKNMNIDVFSIKTLGNIVYINYMQVVEGALVHANTLEVKQVLDENESDVLMLVVSEMIEKRHIDVKEIIVPFELPIEFPGIKYTIPKSGDKKTLLDFSERNLKFYILEQEKRKSLVDPERNTKRILQTMMQDLRMNVEPRRIECFDNSNIQGADAVAAMVCFIDAKPAKKEYRHYNIKTVEGPNDFASMEEVVYRRYKRVLDEGLDMPQLIVIDGGKGQLSSALKSLHKLDLLHRVCIIGIAKRLEELYFPGDDIPIYLNKNSETLKIIQQLRDEAHRFGITHHKNKRSKRMLGSVKKPKKGQ